MPNSFLNIRQYLKEHLALYLFVSVLFVMGVIFGALMVNALTLEQKQELGSYLNSFFHSMDQDSGSTVNPTLAGQFGMHVKWLLLIWVLGLSIIGLPLILVMDFLKGVLIGFSVGYLVGQLSWRGMLFALASVAPQNLLVIPAVIICSVSAISFSLLMINNRLLARKGGLSQPFMSYTGTVFSMVALVLGVSLYEAFLSPSFMKWAASFIHVKA